MNQLGCSSSQNATPRPLEARPLEVSDAISDYCRRIISEPSPVTIPFVFLRNIPERLEGNEHIPGEVEGTNVNSREIEKLKSHVIADETEEEVFNCLVRYGVEQFMCVFHNFKLTDEKFKEFQDSKKDANGQDIKPHKEFDFIILHGNFTAVSEVKGLKKISKQTISYGCSQLKQGVEVLKWINGDARVEVKRILCLPMIENCEEMREGVDIVCSTGEGFENNLRMVLNRYTLESSKSDQLAGLSQRLAKIYFSGHEQNKADLRLYTPGRLISVIDSRVKIQDVRKGVKREPPVIGFVNTEQKSQKVLPSEKFLPRFITPQQRIANGRKKMILIGAAGTGKTLLTKAKIEELTTSGEEVIAVPSAESSFANYADYANNKNVQIWTPEYLEKEFKLDTIAKDLGRVDRSYAYMKTIHNLGNRMTESEIKEFEQASDEFVIEDSRESKEALKETRTDNLEKSKQGLSARAMNITMNEYFIECFMMTQNASRITGMYIDMTFIQKFKLFGSDRSNYDYGDMSDLFDINQAELEQQIRDANEASIKHIKNKNLQNILKRLEKNWNSAKVKLYEIFENNNFFIDDAFSSGALLCLDILSYFAIDWLNTKTRSLTKYLWIAGDPNQVICDKHKFSFQKFFMNSMNKQSIIHKETVCLGTVLRCSKNVFQQWQPVLGAIQSCLSKVLNVDKSEFFEVESVDKHEMHIPDYGYHFAGTSIALSDFEILENLVKDIRDRITSLTNDKSLGHSNFAVLCCATYSAREQMLNAIREQFDNVGFLTQSISEFNQMTDDERANNEKIILDLPENSVGLEWTVVYVICSNLHYKSHGEAKFPTYVESISKPHSRREKVFDLRFEIQYYLACSRSRVLLYLYLFPNHHHKVFFDGEPSNHDTASVVLSDASSRGGFRIVRRSSSIVITGLPPKNDVTDAEQFANLCLEHFEINPSVRSTARLGKRSTNKPLLVNLSNYDDAEFLIEKSRMLRYSTDEFRRKNVFIDPFLTPAEVKSAYELRKKKRLLKKKKTVYNSTSNRDQIKSIKPSFQLMGPDLGLSLVGPGGICTSTKYCSICI